MIEFEIKDNKIISGKHEFDCCEVDINRINPSLSLLPLTLHPKLIAYNNWFTRDIVPIWNEQGVTKRLHKQVKSYLEVGVNCGVSFAFVMQHFLADNGKAIGVDPYSHGSRDRMHVGLRIAEQLCEKNLTPWAGRFQLIKQPSNFALMGYLQRNDFLHHITNDEGDPFDTVTSFDFVYVDGSHYGPDALLDMMLAWDLMVDGGIMIVDDFNRQFLRGAKLVRPAAMAFFDVYSNQIEPLFMTQRQIGFIKRG